MLKVAGRSIKKLRLYPLIWRWHFFMGIVITPLLIIAAGTGGLYIFRSELEPLLYPELVVVRPLTEKVPFTAQLSAIQANADYDGYIPYRIMVAAENNRPHKIYLFHPTQEEIWVYVDPYRGDVLGHQSNSSGFFDIVINIHQTLLAGRLGRYLVETATAWGIVTLVTGLFLWWPRTRQKRHGVFVPRLRKSWTLFWRDLHAIPGVLLLVFSLLIMFTSMNFTQLGKFPLLKLAEWSGQTTDLFVSPPLSNTADGGPPLTVDEIVARYQASRPTAELNIALPLRAEDAYEISANTTRNYQNFRVAYFDQTSGEVLLDAGWEDIPPFGRLFYYFFPIHIGSIWGMPTKVLALLSCLVLIWAPLSGLIMWWRRRPNQSWLKAPPLPTQPTVNWWIVGITLFLGLLLPTVGLSLLIIGGLSWLKILILKTR